MKVLDLITGSAGRPWAQTFLMDNNRYYKRVIREDTQGSKKIVWLCGGIEGQEPFVEISNKLSKELEDTCQAWLSAKPSHIEPSKDRSSSAMLTKVLRLSLCMSLSWSAAFSVLDSRTFPLWARFPLAALTAFSVCYTASSLSEKQK